MLCDTLFVTKVLLLVHVVAHHFWRRRKLKRNQTTIVEITANTSKVRIHILHQSHNHPDNRRYGRAQKLKEELDSWSRRIKNLNPNPKLISTEVSPIEYGNGLGKPLWLFINCTFNTAVGDLPTHWFRMKAYDMATEFGLSLVQLL